jgi:hypothetical protein
MRCHRREYVQALRSQITTFLAWENNMPNAEDILWFKQQFHRRIEAVVQDTQFSLDMLTAVAYQETGYIWQVVRK